MRGRVERVGFIGRWWERGMYMWCSSTRAGARMRTRSLSLGVSTSSAAFALLTVLLAINNLAPCLPVPHHVPAQRQPRCSSEWRAWCSRCAHNGKCHNHAHNERLVRCDRVHELKITEEVSQTAAKAVRFFGGRGRGGVEVRRGGAVQGAAGERRQR